jgi:hypothetical protein
VDDVVSQRPTLLLNMLLTLVIALQALALTSASVVQKRQDGGVASNIPSQATVDEPARGEGRRILGQ